MSRRTGAFAWFLASAVILTNCRSTEPSDIGPPGLRTLSGDTGTDTVMAYLPRPLVIEMRDSGGAPQSGVLLRVLGVNAALSETADTILFFSYLTDITDAHGQLRAYVRLGPKAGPATVAIKTWDLRDSIGVAYTVRPGAPAQILIAIRDSAAYVGNGYTVPANAADRYRNPLPLPIAYNAGNAVADVDPAGRITAKAIGRGFVVLRSAGVIDTAWVTVPPRGMIAAYDVGPPSGTGGGIAVFQLDGSGYRLLHPMGGEPYYGTWPTWTADGRVLFSDGGYEAERLYVLDTLGGGPKLVFAAGPTTGDRFGSVSRNGAWLYYDGSGAGGGFRPWRARPDGTEAAPLGVDSLSGNRPSPAPDGSRVVMLGALLGDFPTLFVVDPAAPSVLRMQLPSFPPPTPAVGLPRWSPDGTLILFWLDNSLWVTQPDGQGMRRLTTVGVSYLIGHDWSPDGQWLITRRPNLLELYNVTSGVRLPLPYGLRFIEPVWRP